MLVAVMAGWLAACGAPSTAPPAPDAAPEAAALTHDAYVWQRTWTPAVRAAVGGAPAELGALRVIALEVGRGAPVAIAVDAASLARAARPVIAVVRIDGSRPPAALSLAPLLERLAAWRQAGVDVVGVEIDHDCATAGLADYAAWLAAHRPPPPLAWSITALPTWATAPAPTRAQLAAAVDELVVQVHAVRAPRLFDAVTARRWLEAFAAAMPGARLRVALPTYRVTVDGVTLASAPDEVAGLVRSLERAPVVGVGGVVWFRLPVAGDASAWPRATLQAVITGAPLAAAVTVELVARAPGVHDIVLTNTGTVAAPWPALTLSGALAAADLLGGYAPLAADHRRWAPPNRDVPAGTRTVVGWATGKDLRVASR